MDLRNRTCAGGAAAVVRSDWPASAFGLDLDAPYDVAAAQEALRVWRIIIRRSAVCRTSLSGRRAGWKPAIPGEEQAGWKPAVPGKKKQAGSLRSQGRRSRLEACDPRKEYLSWRVVPSVTDGRDDERGDGGSLSREPVDTAAEMIPFAADCEVSNALTGTVNQRALIIRPSPTRNATSPPPAAIRVNIWSLAVLVNVPSRKNESITAKPTAALITPSRNCLIRRSSGDSRNFSTLGSTSSTTCLRSPSFLISRIRSAMARPISSRALAAEVVMVSGRCNAVRTRCSSPPQERQNWL